MSYVSVELSAVRDVVYTMSNISLLSVSVCLQGPVGFPGDPGPPGEAGAAVSATFITQSLIFRMAYNVLTPNRILILPIPPSFILDFSILCNRTWLLYVHFFNVPII